MGGTSKTTATTFQSQPGINEVLGTAKTIFNSGVPWAPDTTSHVTPFSTQTSVGLDGLYRAATGSAVPLRQNFDRVNATLGDGGLNNLQDAQVKRLNEVAAGSGLNRMQQTAYYQLTPTGSGLNSLQQNAYRQLTPSATGLSGLQQRTYNQLTPTASGLNSLQQQAYRQLAPTASGLNADQQRAMKLLNPIAAGQTMNGNPYLEQLIKRTSDDIASSSNLQASAAGRYGSGSHQGVLADAVGDMSAELRYQNYSDEAARRDAAIRDVFGMGTTGASQRSAGLLNQANLATTGANQRADALAQQFNIATAGQNQRANALNQQFGMATTGTTQRANALNQQFNIGTTGQNQRMDAIGSLFNAGQQQRQNQLAGTQQLSDAYKARLDPYRTMLDVGQQYEGLNSRVLQDQARILQERQNAMTDPVNWLANLAAAFQGGQQIQTSRTTESPFSNPLLNGLIGKAFGL